MRSGYTRLTSNMWKVVSLLLFGVGVAVSSAQQVSLGRFLNNGHGLEGEVILLNDRQYMIRGFSYDGAGPAVWHMGMRRGTVGVYSGGGIAFRNEAGGCERLGKAYRGKDVTITVPGNVSISRDLEAISVYCFRFCHNFGHVRVPRGLVLSDGPRGKGNRACNTGYKPCSMDGTRDNGVCSNGGGRDETCMGGGPKKQGRNGGGGGGGAGGNGGRGRNRNGNGDGRALARGNGNSGRGRGRNPGGNGGSRVGPAQLGRFTSYANGVVGDVTILNDKQFRVRGFGYNGARGKSTYFLLMEKGVPGVFSVKGWAVGDERGRCGGFTKSYRNEDIVITVPDEINLSRDVGAIAVYDYERCVNFGHVRVGENVVEGSVGVFRGGAVEDGGNRRRGRNNNRRRGNQRKVCLPYFRPCSRRDTKNNAVCLKEAGRNGRSNEITC